MAACNHDRVRESIELSLTFKIWRRRKETQTSSSTKSLLQFRLKQIICWKIKENWIQISVNIREDGNCIRWNTAYKFWFLFFSNQWFILCINQNCMRIAERSQQNNVQTYYGAVALNHGGSHVNSVLARM